MANIRKYNPVTGESGYCIAVARASVGIYFALLEKQYPEGSKIIVPANLCYAGIFPAIYAGLKPEFCDVDPFTGNVTFDTFSSAYDADVVAAIIPHMYGNPVEQLPEIAAFCRMNQILLIEDCASAMGASAQNYKLGSVGDYVVYSTGYSKTLDLGFGGFLFSKNYDLSFTESLEEQLPDISEESERNMAFFSKLYRLIRNAGSDTKIEKMIFRGLSESCRDDFLHKIDNGKKAWLFEQIKNLPDVIEQRRSALAHYKEKLEGCCLQPYPYAVGSVPWRYNFFVDGGLREFVIKRCLEEGLPVSDWYPRVTNLFGVHDEFPGAKMHEKMILNFPLLVSTEKIDQICMLIQHTISTRFLEV